MKEEPDSRAEIEGLFERLLDVDSCPLWRNYVLQPLAACWPRAADLTPAVAAKLARLITERL